MGVSSRTLGSLFLGCFMLIEGAIPNVLGESLSSFDAGAVSAGGEAPSAGPGTPAVLGGEGVFSPVCLYVCSVVPPLLERGREEGVWISYSFSPFSIQRWRDSSSRSFVCRRGSQ